MLFKGYKFRKTHRVVALPVKDEHGNIMPYIQAGKESYVEPVVEGAAYRFSVKVGKPKHAEKAKNGTKLAGANFVCLMSGAPISGDYIKAEGRAGRIGARMMAIVAEGEHGPFTAWFGFVQFISSRPLPTFDYHCRILAPITNRK